MEEYRKMIQDDIAKCDDLIRSGYASRRDLDAFVGKYSMMPSQAKNFEAGIFYHVILDGHAPNEIDNIHVIKEKLNFLLATANMPSTTKEETAPREINITNKNINNVSFTNITISEAKNIINNDGSLSDTDKKVLLEKLEEIVKIRNRKSNKDVKWGKAIPIIRFALDKGTDIAIMLLTQALMAVNS